MNKSLRWFAIGIGSLCVGFGSITHAGFAIFPEAPEIDYILVAEEDSPKPDSAIKQIKISPKAHSLNPCETKKFIARVKNKSGKNIKGARVKWESVNPKIAKVDKNGLVEGVNPGFTFIRAVNGSIRSNVASVFVRDKGVRRC